MKLWRWTKRIQVDAETEKEALEKIEALLLSIDCHWAAIGFVADWATLKQVRRRSHDSSVL